MGAAAARTSLQLVPTMMGMAKPEANTVSAAGAIDPRPVQLLVGATEAEIRATNLLGEGVWLSILIRGSCLQKSLNTEGVRGIPRKTT